MEPYPTEMRNWLVMDGAYAYRPLLKPILALGVTVVSRPRKDAGLRTLPPRKQPGKPGKRKYGLERISLAKRAAHRCGWHTLEAVLYGGQRVTKTYKTFLATWPVTGGVVRVVLVRESRGKWDAFFCTCRAACLTASRFSERLSRRCRRETARAASRGKAREAARASQDRTALETGRPPNGRTTETGSLGRRFV